MIRPVISALFVLLIVIPSIVAAKERQPTWFETLSAAEIEYAKKVADRVCPVFAKNPERLREVPEGEWRPCEYYEQYAGKQESPTKGSCITKESRLHGPVTVAVVSSGGSCSSSSAVIISNDAPRRVKESTPKNAAVNGYGFGRYDRVLADGADILVTDDLRSDLRLVMPNSVVVLCGFDYQLQGWSVASWNRASVCEKFANDEFDLLEPVETPAADELASEKLERETHVYGVLEADIDGDGKPEKILDIRMDSGAGCGCGLQSLGLAKSELATSEGENLDKKLSSITELNTANCHVGGRWSIVTIDGSAYLARDTRLPKKGKDEKLVKPASSRNFPDRILYKYKDGEFNEVCHLKPDARRVIDKDVSSPLNYTPLK